MGDYEIAGFQLLDRIGEGTYGDVYKARSLEDNRIYAIKFVRLYGFLHLSDPISRKLSE